MNRGSATRMRTRLAAPAPHSPAHTATSSEREPTAPEADAFEALLADGRDLDAMASARAFAPFEKWSSPRARQSAAYLCDALGAPLRSRAITLRTIRRSPRSVPARLARVACVAEARRPLAGSPLLAPGAPPEGPDQRGGHLPPPPDPPTPRRPPALARP